MRIPSAETIARGLERSRRVAGGWLSCCPSHDDREPSLSIRDASGKVLVYCHAGCKQEAVLIALKERGLWGIRDFRRPLHRSAAQHYSDQQELKRRAFALSIWRSSLPGTGTPVEAYLAVRGLTPPLPSSLRFHRGLRHPSGGRWPCMVALVTQGDVGSPLAIHRTFLARDGGRKAPVDPARMMLGPCRGGAVRLGVPDQLLMVGEGIETCLAAMQATGHPAWAALSTAGLRALDLPETVYEVIVLADGDESGEAAAKDCALRWMRRGRRVRIARPTRGLDFNDILLGRAPRSEESAP